MENMEKLLATLLCVFAVPFSFKTCVNLSNIIRDARVERETCIVEETTENSHISQINERMYEIKLKEYNPIPEEKTSVSESSTEVEKSTEAEEDENIIGSSIQVKVDESEVRLLAQLITLEAGGTSYECQKAVGSVVLNRMNRNNQTLREVIFAKGQFSVADRVESTEPYDSCVQVAKELLSYGSILPADVLFFRSGHYFSEYTPYMNKDNVYFSKG